MLPALRDGVDSRRALYMPYSVTMTDQSVHPFTQSLGFAVAEGAPASSGQSTSLQALSVSVTGAGLRVRFNQSFDVQRLLAAGDLGSHIVVMRDQLPVKGRIVVDPDGEGFTFIVEGALLPEGAYTVRLRSGPEGFAKPNGDALDGDYDGKPGGDYRGRFNVAYTLRPGLIGSGAADHLTAVAGVTGAVAVAGDLDWTARRFSLHDDAAAGSAWAALTGGIGGLVTLAVAPGVIDTRMARRALAAGGRRPAADPLHDKAPIRIAPREPQAAPGAATRQTPAWVSRWLGSRTPDARDWRVRL